MIRRSLRSFNRWFSGAWCWLGHALTLWQKKQSGPHQPPRDGTNACPVFDRGAWLIATLAVLGVVFVTAVIGQAWKAIRQTVEKSAEEKVQLALEFNVAVRQYVNDTIRPEFKKRARGGEFVPEVMSSSFVARSIFEHVHERIPDFLLRFPSNNPRNLINRASEQESLIIRHFEQNPRAEVWQGTIEHAGKTFYARATARRFQESCLYCHGDPKDAPADLVARYGSEPGFGNSLGDVSLDLAGVSVDETLAVAWDHLRSHMLLAAGLGVVFLGGSAAVICLDFHRRRRSAIALQDQKQEISSERAKLQAIFDSVQVGLLLVDEKTRVTRVNDVVAKLVGREASELLNRQPGDGLCCIHATESPDGCGHAEACLDCTTRKTIETVLAQGKPLKNVEALLQLSIGGQLTSIWASLSATPMELDGKKHVLVAIVDITQRKAAEQRYRALFESSRDALLTLAPPDWRFSSANPAALALFGFPNEAEFLKARIEDIAPRTQPDGRLSTEKAKEMLEKAMREGVHCFEWVHKRRGGSDFPSSVMLSRVDLGDQAFLFATVRDITVRKENERKQQEYAATLERQKAEMEKLYHAAEAATRAKSEFLANMSHEIRTPMTAILGYVDLLESQIDCCNECEKLASCQIRHLNREHLATIRRNGQHLLQIINDILDLSKIEAGKLDVEWQAVSPVAILADVVSLMRVRAEAKELDLKLEFASPMPETILTDPARLRQILLNLVGNAIKFTDTGSVRVVARVDGIGAAKPRFICEVIDTGKGMTEEQVRGLFRPFHQADASTSRKYGGTGLGLAISKRLAGMLKGDITVNSHVGVGSTFVVNIDPGPLADVAFHDRPSEVVAPPKPASPPRREPSLSGRRILLAEDGIDNQRLIAFLLNKAGAEVTVVENGQQALKTALAAPPDGGDAATTGRPFDLILMDMQMPIMDGYQATRRLRAYGYRGPIVALTAHAMAEDRQKCLDAGCDEYLSKPIDRTRLLSTLANLLKTSQDRTEEPTPEVLAP